MSPFCTCVKMSNGFKQVVCACVLSSSMAHGHPTGCSRRFLVARDSAIKHLSGSVKKITKMPPRGRVQYVYSKCLLHGGSGVKRWLGRLNCDGPDTWDCSTGCGNFTRFPNLFDPHGLLRVRVKIYPRHYSGGKNYGTFVLSGFNGSNV